jgi:phage FluMu gp28-like protein
VTILDAVEQGLVEKIKRLKARDDAARQEWLDELRSTCPTRTPGTRSTCAAEQRAVVAAELPADPGVRGRQPPAPGRRRPAAAGKTLYAGFDVGRKRDLSSSGCSSAVGDVYWTRLLRTLQGVHFTAQEDLLSACCCATAR